MIKRILAVVSALILAGSFVAPALALAGDPPADPSNAVATVVSDTTVNLDWTDNSDTETGFTIFYTSDNWQTTQTAAVIQDIVHFVVTGLTPNTRYSFRVQAVDNTDPQNILTSNSTDSNAVLTYASKPGQPAVGAVTMTTIPLTLDGNGNPASALYALTWADLNTNKGSAVDANGDATVNGSVYETLAFWNNSGLVKSLTPGHTYAFRIFSYNVDNVKAPGTDGYIDTNQITTLADPSKPTTPIISYIEGKGQDLAGNSQNIDIQLGKAANPGNETKFVIGYSTDNGATYNDVVMPIEGEGSPEVCKQEGGAVVPNCYFYNITGLKPVTNYLVRVATVNEAGDVSAYYTASVTTGYNQILPPTISNITDQSVDAIIDTNGNPESLKYQLAWAKVHYDQNGNPVIEKLGPNSSIGADGLVGGAAVWQTPAQWAKVSVHGFRDLGFESLDFALYTFAVENGVEIFGKGGSNKIGSAPSKEFTIKPIVVKVETSNPPAGGGGGGGNAFVPTPPTLNQNAVVIVEGDKVNKRAITLKFSASNATHVAVSENQSFADAIWENFAETKPFTLSEGNGLKNVYVKFRSVGGGETAAVKVSTTLGSPATTVTTNTTVTTGQVLGVKISRVDDLISQLKLGKSGALVVELQNELKKLGFFPKSVKSTGYYGPITQTAVKKYLASKK